jgi:nitrogenase molybdenum-cofactor synthesis protein NifE
VIPVMSEGFKGNKRAGLLRGLQRPCSAWWAPATPRASPPMSVNLLGDFNLAGEIWIIREYLERMGVEVVANVTGDGRVDDLRRATAPA